MIKMGENSLCHVLFYILSYCRHEQQLGHVLQSWRQEGLV